MDATDRDDRPPDTRARDAEDRGAEILEDVAFEAVVVQRGSSRAARWRLAAVAAIALLVVGIGALGPRPDGTAFLDLTALFPRPSGSIGPDGSPIAPQPSPTSPPGTPLPAVSFLDPGAQVGPITLMTYENQQSRLILDPSTGSIVTLSDEFQAGLWVADDDGGTLCICRLSPSNAQGERVRIVAVSWDAVGRERSRAALIEYLAPDPVAYEPSPVGPSIALDVALSRDHATAIVGSAIRNTDSPVDRLDAFSVATGEALWSRVLAPNEGRGDHGEISVRLSPTDDRLIATILDTSVRDEMEWRRSSWLLALEGGSGASTPVGDPILVDDGPVAANSWCGGEGFATAERYVVVCSRWSPAGQTSTWVRLVSADDGAVIRDVPITDLGAAFGSAIVDSDTGNVYLWDPSGHRIVRIDANSGSTAIATFGLGSGSGVMGREVSIPLGDHRTDWTTLSSAFAWGAQSTVVGSRDGATLFALAVDDIPEPFRGPIPRSSGIWVFDAASLELLTIIPPAAVHDAISLTADGRHVLATGIPGLDEQARPSDWGSSISIFDARDGHLVARLGALAANNALGPSLVWPPPGR